MHRHCGIHGNPSRLQRSLLAGKIAFRLGAVHAPGQVRVRAEGLLVDEVSPAADSLADQKTLNRNVQHRRDFHLMDFGHYYAAQQSADDAAVNSQAALVYVKDLYGILPIHIAGIENHIVKPCADDAQDQSGDDAVDEMILVALADFQRIKKRQNEAQGD